MHRNYYKNCTILIFILSLFFTDQNTISQKFDIKNFNENTPLSSAFIYSITKDSLGYIWIGTAEGLVRFNGKSFRSYTVADSLSDNFVSCVIHDGPYLWIGHMNGSLTLFDRSIFKRVSFTINDPGPITGFDKDPYGAVWMSTYNGNLVKLNRHQGVIQIKTLMQGEAIHTFRFIDHERLIAGTSSGLYLCRITSSAELEVIKKISQSGQEQINAVVYDVNENAYYAATTENIIYKTDSTFRIVDTISGISNIQSIAADKFNRLWIATFGNGLVSYDLATGNLTNFFETTGDDVKTVFCGDDGNIWAGGYGTGLTKITNQIFDLLEYPFELYGSQVRAIYHKGNDAWIATEKGIIKSDLKGKISYFKEHLSSPITALVSDNQGNLWIGTESDGIFILNEEGRFNKLQLSTGSLEQSITALEESQAYIWAGTKKGLCRITKKIRDEKWYTISDGLPHNSINGLFADNKGRLWISSKSNILAYLTEEKIERVIIRTTNPSIPFSEFTNGDSTLVWAGTLGNGIFRLGLDSVLRISSQDGMYSDFCHNLIRDDRDHIWVIHKEGLSRINNSNLFVRSFDQLDAISENVSFMPGAASLDDEGKIWIGTSKGVFIIDQSKEMKGNPPVPDILSIRVNNEEYHPRNGRITLKPGKYTIAIEYGAISQKEPDMVTYTIYLEGYDEKPEFTRLNLVEYRNLTEGTFIFKLSALNGDGVSSEAPESLEIFIRTPLLKQLWFYTVILIIIGAIIIGYIKRKEYIFKEERKILEEKVLERTKEIQAQKDEIEEQRDLIRQKNAEITSSIRYALEIQNALLPPETKFDRYFPENFIFMRAKDIVSGDFYWIARKNDRLIFTVADCTGHGVPGAFMSMLSISLLNEIVNVEGITDSDKIVNRLHNLVRKSLNRSRADGLDMALCSYDWTNRVIYFTGAMNNLIYFRNGEQCVLKADQCSVNMATDEAVTFSAQELKVQKGDMIYLYSDGFMDQFGGENDKKFSIKRFYCLLNEIHLLPVKEQESILEQRLSDWIQDRVQTDDITILGIRF